MKKRTGVERAVIVMAVVVVLLAIALIVVNAAGPVQNIRWFCFCTELVNGVQTMKNN